MMMSAEGFRGALGKLGLKQVAAARLLEKNDRTIRRWLEDGIQNDPVTVILLNLLMTGKVSVQDVERVKMEEMVMATDGSAKE